MSTITKRGSKYNAEHTLIFILRKIIYCINLSSRYTTPFDLVVLADGGFGVTCLYICPYLALSTNIVRCHQL